MKDKHIWRVTAYSLRYIPDLTEEEATNEWYLAYDHYFTDYDEANATYRTGEQTMGPRHGMSWNLSRITVDTMYSQQDMDDLAAALTAQEGESK